MSKGVKYAPSAPTCGDRVLDYFVVSECLAQAWAIVATCVIGDQTFGPHSPVRLIVKANSRTVMVRELKVPAGFSANLPFGPMPQTGCPSVLCSYGNGNGTDTNDGTCNVGNARTGDPRGGIMQVPESNGSIEDTLGGSTTAEWGTLCYLLRMDAPHEVRQPEWRRHFSE